MKKRLPISRLNILVCIFSACSIISCQQDNTLLTSVSSSKTNIQFENNLEKRDIFGILYYLYYYNGGGVAIGDVNNDGLADIYFTANSYGNNKLYINKGDLKFEDITENAGVMGTADWCSGVTMADVNGDGYLDIYVSAVSQHHGLNGKNQLYINNKNSTFTESAAAYGLDFSGFSTQAAFFDYDHDGDLDCYLLNQSQKPNENIVDTSHRRQTDAFSGDRFYRNDLNTTAKKFTDVSKEVGIYQSSLGYGLGIAVADINNDGWDDIYIGNDFHENDYYYVNNGNGTFTESGAKYFDHYSRFSMGNDVADYNNDGQLDVVTVDMLPGDEKVLKTYGSDEHADIYKLKLLKNGFQYQYSKNCLQRNNGSGSSFSETSLLNNVSATDWSWCPLFADFDNDGNKDLFISSGIVKRPVDLDYVNFVSNLYMKGMNKTDKYDDEALDKMPDGSSHPFFYKGDGSSFKDVSTDWGTGKMKGFYNGAAYADLDNDGDLDLVMNCLNAKAIVMKNNTVNKNYASIDFKGNKANTKGVGCKAYIFQKGKMQYQEMMPTRGFQSSSDLRLHFGLDAATIDSVLIVWPTQQFQVLKNVAVNKLIVAYQKDAAGLFSYTSFFKQSPSFFSNITDSLQFNWKHKENPFDDFNQQYLIPHCESTRGPKIATADVNGDGLDDIYACGAKGQPGTLLIQQQNGTFIQKDSAVFNRDAAFEDVDAVFVEANGDGKPDLFVVSGGNEAAGGAAILADRLYLNDGNGHFEKTVNVLPEVFQNKSSVSVTDIDHDGDMDLFVGTLASASAYGVPQTSTLLINDGHAHYTIAPKNVIALDTIGMVTTSTFTDVNNDGWQDLVVTGEFMPVMIFINNKGQFTKTEILNSTGWWQTVFADDVNGDGNMDILAGNWGLNNKFSSGKNGPVKMYVGDFDKNGKVDQLLAYTLEGVEYPFFAKDEVERPLPLLKKHYLLYGEYAGVQMKDVFYGWIDNTKPIMAERLASAILFGDGKGGFTIQNLPADLQMAPIFSFQKAGETNADKTYIAAGNFFDVVPYEGRYDAQPLALFSVGKNKTVQSIPQQNLSAAKGQFRDLKWVRTKSGQVLAAARNDDGLLLYRREKN